MIIIKKQQKYQYYHLEKLINNLTGEERLPSDQRRAIEQATFPYSPLGKAFEKQIKTIQDEGIKHVEALKALKPERNEELK